MSIPCNFAFLVSLFIFLCSCSHLNNNKYRALDTIPPLIDTSNIAIIPFDQIGNWPFDNRYETTNLTEMELIELDRLISDCIAGYNSGLQETLKNDYGIDIKRKYKRQYVPVLNNKGKKEIWVNVFCSTWDNRWKKEILLVHDGGNCYFNLKINLSTRKCFDFSVNGYA